MAVYILRSTWIFFSIFLPSPPVWLYISLYLPALCLSLPLFFSVCFFLPPSASYFSWFIVRRGVSVRPGLPLCVCECGAVVYGGARDKSCFSLRCVKTVAWGENDGRWTDDTPERGRRSRKRRGEERDAAATGSSFCSGSAFTGLLSSSSSSFSTCASLTLLRLFTPDYYSRCFLFLPLPLPLSHSAGCSSGSWITAATN